MIETPLVSAPGIHSPHKFGRLGFLLLIGQLAWALPGTVGGTLFQALAAEIDPRAKIAIYSSILVAGGVASALGTLVGGMLSDRTRSRLGRRSPWLLRSSILAALALTAAGSTESPILIGVSFVLFQAGVGAWVAARSAITPDHVRQGSVGKASAFSGFISAAAVDHYRRIVESVVAAGRRPLVTLHHFTVPLWFAASGGWLRDDAATRFAGYVAVLAPVLDAGVDAVGTINEPNIVAALPALAANGSDLSQGIPEPDPLLSARMVEMHRAASAVVRAQHPAIKVGWGISVQDYQLEPGAEAALERYAEARAPIFSAPAPETISSAFRATPARASGACSTTGSGATGVRRSASWPSTAPLSHAIPSLRCGGLGPSRRGRPRPWLRSGTRPAPRELRTHTDDTETKELTS